MWDLWKNGTFRGTSTGHERRLVAVAALFDRDESETSFFCPSTFWEILAILRFTLTRKSLASRLLALGLGSVGSDGHSGKSIQFWMRSAKLLSPRTSGCRLRPCVSRAAVQSSGSLGTSNDVHFSKQASDVDLGRVLGRGLGSRRRSADAARTFLNRRSTTGPSSGHEASEYPESNSRLLAALLSSSSRGQESGKAESALLESLASLIRDSLIRRARRSRRPISILQGPEEGGIMQVRFSCFRSCRERIIQRMCSLRHPPESWTHNWETEKKSGVRTLTSVTIRREKQPTVW